MLPCFDTKSVKITHFHLFIKEIILLFIHLRKIFHKNSTKVRIAFCTTNFQIHQERSKFNSSFHFVKENLKQNVSRNSYKLILRYQKFRNKYKLFYKNSNPRIIE